MVVAVWFPLWLLHAQLPEYLREWDWQIRHRRRGTTNETLLVLFASCTSPATPNVTIYLGRHANRMMCFSPTVASFPLTESNAPPIQGDLDAGRDGVGRSSPQACATRQSKC